MRRSTVSSNTGTDIASPSVAEILDRRYSKPVTRLLRFLRTGSWVGQSDHLNVEELRRHRRYAVTRGVLNVSWRDQTGKVRTARSRGRDVAEGGIALELPHAAVVALVTR